MSCWVCAALEIKQRSRDQPLIFQRFLSVFSLEAGFFVWADHRYFWLIWAQPSFLQVSQLAPVSSGVTQSWLNTSFSQIASKFIRLQFSFAAASIRADKGSVGEVLTGSEMTLDQCFHFIYLYLNCTEQNTCNRWGALTSKNDESRRRKPIRISVNILRSKWDSIPTIHHHIFYFPLIFFMLKPQQLVSCCYDIMQCHPNFT